MDKLRVSLIRAEKTREPGLVSVPNRAMRSSKFLEELGAGPTPIFGFQSAEHFLDWCGTAILAVVLNGLAYFRIPYIIRSA
jgi:hypothetical protein